LHDVTDSVFFSLAFVLLQVVCIQSIVQELYGSVFVLGWVVGGVGDYCVRKSGFSIYGCLPTGGGSLDGEVKVVYLVTGLGFSCELQVGVHLLENF
jgi:hypothetical protein